MTNAFHWQGKPSIFTTASKQQPLGMGREQSRMRVSLRKKPMPVALPGSSKFVPPDVLRTGGELGKKLN